MSVPPEPRNNDDRRSAKRIKVFLLGTIAPEELKGSRAHVLDISVSGARVHAEQEQLVGTELTLTVDEVETRGNVEWVEGKRFGMSFAAG